MRLITTVIVLALFAGGFGLLYIYSGAYNVAATAPHGTAESWLYETVMQKSVRARARAIEAPPLDDPAMVARGGRMYGERCESCHGGPGIILSDLARGLRPRAPDLARAAQDWKPRELFWIVKNGIKMTGMPAWGPSHDDAALWSVVAFVTRLPEMRYEDYWSQTRGGGEHPATSDATDDAGPDDAARPGAGVVKEIPASPTDTGKTEAKAPADPGKTATATPADKGKANAGAPAENAGKAETTTPAGKGAADGGTPGVRVQARPQPKPEVPQRPAPARRQRR
jgi:mono/diheme cytochrome c family protein